MANEKHTPGPWYVNSTVEIEPGKTSRVVHNVFNRDGLFCHVAECGNLDNARLIAEAPVLLSELQRTADYLQSACIVISDAAGRASALEQVKAARAAIAKSA